MNWKIQLNFPPFKLFPHFYKKSVGHIYGGLSWVLHLVALIYAFIFLQIPHCINDFIYIISLMSGRVIPLTLLFFSGFTTHSKKHSLLNNTEYTYMNTPTYMKPISWKTVLTICDVPWFFLTSSILFFHWKVLVMTHKIDFMTHQWISQLARFYLNFWQIQCRIYF